MYIITCIIKISKQDIRQKSYILYTYDIYTVLNSQRKKYFNISKLFVISLETRSLGIMLI